MDRGDDALAGREFVTPAEAAELIGVSKVTIWRWRREGYMRAVVPPGETMQQIPVDEVRKFIN